MDELTKYRITGAVIWLALLVILVPSWYANPVDYEKAQPWLFSSSDEALPTEETVPVNEAIESNSSSVEDVKKAPSKVKPEPESEKLDKPSQTKIDSISEESKPATPAIQDSVSAETNKESEVELDEPIKSEQSIEIKEPVMPSEDKSPAWLVRVASYNSIESANRTLGVLEMRYKVTIGDFSNKTQKIYSVRVGPFSSFEEAQEAKAQLDQELVTNSVIVQIR